jgi:hypothetical protein
MVGPTFSDDGYWMWNGTDWVPAPSQSQIIPQSALDLQQISSAANNAGLSQNALRNAAPYFDQNTDGRLQSIELQQAVNYVSNPVPSSPVPQQHGGQYQHGGIPQSNVVPQNQYPKPMIYNSSSRKPNSGGSSLMVLGIIFLVLCIAGAGVGIYYVSEYNTSEFTSDSNNVDYLDDLDSDSDGIENYDDSCPNGDTGWTSTKSTDNDGDGCRDSTEDDDDDDDGKSDSFDDCPSGSTGWTSSSYTDFDGDGCQDNGEDYDDDNDGYSDSNDWYDAGNGAISLKLTRFTAWANGYYDGDGSNPDVYAYIGVDYSCSSSPDYTYYSYSVHQNSYDLSDWFYKIYDISESATTVCIDVQIWDNDATSDDQLDYVEGSPLGYYYTIELDEGEGSFSKSYDNRGENDVSIKLELEFSRISN